MKNWLAYLLALTCGILLSGVIVLVSRPPRGNPLVLEPIPTPAPVAVHVGGAVSNPGVYELPPGSRVRDAVLAAGGMSDEADQVSVNLAASIKDGERILIPFLRGSSTSTSRQPEGVHLPTSAPSEVSFPLDLNTATTMELESLPGIGPTRAQDIVLYRQEHGPFKTIEDIMGVNGIAFVTFEKIKDLIYVK